MQYHDLRGRIGAHMAGDRKKSVQKVQNTTFWPFFGGGVTANPLYLKLFKNVHFLMIFKVNFRKKSGRSCQTMTPEHS